MTNKSDFDRAVRDATSASPDGTALGNLRHVVATFADSDADTLVVQATGNVYPFGPSRRQDARRARGHLHRADPRRSAGAAAPVGRRVTYSPSMTLCHPGSRPIALVA